MAYLVLRVGKLCYLSSQPEGWRLGGGRRGCSSSAPGFACDCGRVRCAGPETNWGMRWRGIRRFISASRAKWERHLEEGWGRCGHLLDCVASGKMLPCTVFREESEDKFQVGQGHVVSTKQNDHLDGKRGLAYWCVFGKAGRGRAAGNQPCSCKPEWSSGGAHGQMRSQARSPGTIAEKRAPWVVCVRGGWVMAESAGEVSSLRTRVHVCQSSTSRYAPSPWG